VKFEFWYGKLFSFGEKIGASFKVNIEKKDNDAMLKKWHCVSTTYVIASVILRATFSAALFFDKDNDDASDTPSLVDICDVTVVPICCVSLRA
jgi:hypothetical protein